MSAPEQPQGVLLRYAGGEVYALARPVAGLVWDVSVAGSVLRCRLDGSAIPDGAWLRVKVDLTTFAALPAVQRRVDVMTAARVAAEKFQRAVTEAAEHMRAGMDGVNAALTKVAPQRPARAKRTGKAKGRAKR